MASDRAALTTLLTSLITSGSADTTAADLRQYEAEMILSALNKIDDANIAGGYMSISGAGRVTISFINAAVPAGLFLRDDGTWGEITSVDLAGLDQTPGDIDSSMTILQAIGRLAGKIAGPIEVTTPTLDPMVAFIPYIANRATPINFTLPTIASVGDRFIVNGKGAGGWRIGQRAGQTIHGATNSTTGATGYIESTAQYDCVELFCIIANTDFVVMNAQGTLIIF